MTPPGQGQEPHGVAVLGTGRRTPFGWTPGVEMEGLLDRKASCAYLCVGTTTLAALTRRGEITSVVIQRRRLYRRLDLDAFIERNLAQAPAADVVRTPQ